RSRVMAQEAAQRAPGVLGVINELEMRTPQDAQTDAEITAGVRQAVESTVGAAADGVRVAVWNGWVALEGCVDTLLQKQEAEEVSREVKGVRGVYNELDITPAE